MRRLSSQPNWLRLVKSNPLSQQLSFFDHCEDLSCPVERASGPQRRHSCRRDWGSHPATLPELASFRQTHPSSNPKEKSPVTENWLRLVKPLPMAHARRLPEGPSSLFRADGRAVPSQVGGNVTMIGGLPCTKQANASVQRIVNLMLQRSGFTGSALFASVLRRGLSWPRPCLRDGRRRRSRWDA